MVNMFKCLSVEVSVWQRHLTKPLKYAIIYRYVHYKYRLFVSVIMCKIYSVFCMLLRLHAGHVIKQNKTNRKKENKQQFGPLIRDLKINKMIRDSLGRPKI